MGNKDTSEPKTRIEKKGKDKKKDKSGNFIYSSRRVRQIEARQDSIKKI